MKLLVIFDKNWADECNVHGWSIMDDSAYQDLLKALPKLSYSFGTNEGWETGEFDPSDFSATPIGDREEEFLRNTFKPYEDRWGNFPDWQDALWMELWEYRELFENDPPGDHNYGDMAEAKAIVKAFEPTFTFDDDQPFLKQLIDFMENQ